MLFNSVAFLGFAGLFYLFWPLFRRRDLPRWGFIILASFVFYGWWDPRYLVLMAVSGLIDFFTALWIADRPLARKAGVAVSVIANLGLLCAFKYSRFVAENVEAVVALFGGSAPVSAAVPEFMSVVPPGISFYTFQSMSYMIDVGRGQVRPTRNVLHFFAYLAAFPQLVAGPIVRAADLLPAMRSGRPLSEEDRFEGLRWVALGFFKKCVLADNLAPAVNRLFGSSSELSFLGAWGAVTLFAFQIYYDFSGYSDIARGLMRWMGYELPANFDCPYLAASFRGFWQRWHISLSTWFRDYVYIPLGGSQGGRWRGFLTLWATLLLSGLWHGAAWTYVAWGAWSALCLSLERGLIHRPPGRPSGAPALVGWGVTLVGVWIGWALFRSDSMAQAQDVIGSMLWPLREGVGLTTREAVLAAVATCVVFAGPWLGRVAAAWDVRWRALSPVGVGLLIVLSVFLRGPGGDFIYFRF